MKNVKIIYRVLLYMLGLLFMAFGVAFSVNSNLGVSPVNSLPYVVSLITKIDMGTCVVIIFALYILAQVIILRREFKIINLTQLLFSTAFGYFVDFAKWTLGSFAIPTYAGQLLMLTISIVLVAIGVALYMDVKLVNMPMEGMTTAISQKILTKMSFHDVKVMVDCASVIIGVTLSFIFLGGLFGIREGTVICALLVGKLMKPIQKFISPIVKKICF